MPDNNNASQPNRYKYSRAELLTLGVFHLLSLPPVLLLRRRLGKRYLRLFHVSFTSVTIYILWIITLMLAPFLLHNKETVLSFFYLFTVAIAATIHAIEISLRKKNKIIVHSYYSGYPRILPYIPEVIKTKAEQWNVDLPIFVKMYVEPILCVVVGLFAANIELCLGFLMILGGLGIFLWSQYQAANADDEATDIMDGLIETEQVQSKLNLGADNEIFGFESYAPRIKVALAKTKPTPPVAAKEASKEASKLSPELEQLLSEQDDEDEDSQEPATPQPTVKVGVSSSRKEENLPVSRPRGRPRKDNSATYS